MQDRYTGDAGDYTKLALLRALAPGRHLGVAWYLHPDEHHNEDGKHIAYLQDSDRWRALDPDLFDALGRIVAGNRSVAALHESGVLSAHSFDRPVPDARVAPGDRCVARGKWFSDALAALTTCNLIFADPDNGLVDDNPERRRSRTFGKQLPLCEAQALADGRPAIIYHHNTRFVGGHDLEVDHWLNEFEHALAIRSNAYSCRTFFIVNPDRELTDRTEQFCARWSDHGVWMHRPRAINLAA